jgi:hypothetical protein
MATTTKNEVIKHINKLFANKTHTPDAAGNYHDYPIQSLFTIVHFECGGGLVNGFIDLSVSAKMSLTEKNFKVDKSYPSMKLTDGGSNCKHQYSVQINEPKDFTKTTGGDFKQIIIGSEKSLSNHVYKREHHFYFDTFEAANEFYVKMADKLSLTDDTYRNERYAQLYNDRVLGLLVAPEFTKEVYLDLITNFNIF